MDTNELLDASLLLQSAEGPKEVSHLRHTGTSGGQMNKRPDVSSNSRSPARSLQATEAAELQNAQQPSCGVHHDAAKCRQAGKFDPDCCAAIGKGSCAEGFKFKQGAECYMSLVQTCCLPTLTENDIALVTFASRGSDLDLQFAGIRLCDNQFSIIHSASQLNRITFPQKAPIIGKEVHLVLTCDQEGTIQLHREGQLVESVEVTGTTPSVTANTAQAAVLIGTGPNALDLAKANAKYDAEDSVHFEGGFHVARFYPVVMDTTEIREAYEKRKNVRKMSRVVKWD